MWLIVLSMHRNNHTLKHMDPSADLSYITVNLTVTVIIWVYAGAIKIKKGSDLLVINGSFYSCVSLAQVYKVV